MHDARKGQLAGFLDLPHDAKSSLGIDVENGFEPKYITIRGKGDLVASLRKAAAKADKAEEITAKKALKIARKDAGIAKKDVTYSEVDYDMDDGVEKYEVEFHAGGKEYNYDIAKSDGRILEHEVEVDD